MAEKSYNASTGVDKFYYGVLDGTELKIVETAAERVQFLQDIDVAMTSKIVRAYGDNVVAEMAVSHGPVTVSGNFHKIPQTDKDVLLGLEKSTDGLSGYGSANNPPYVAVVFAKTYENGSTEYVGLPKGKFLKTNITGTSKQDETTFSQDPISAEFMDREVTGFENKQSVVTGTDEQGATVIRDAIFDKMFGVTYIDETDTIPAG